MILGLDPEIKPALTALSGLQRKFVRKSDTEFSRQDADNFYNTLGPTSKSILREVHEEFRIKKSICSTAANTVISGFDVSAG
jgi:hypothetical protein